VVIAAAIVLIAVVAYAGGTYGADAAGAKSAVDPDIGMSESARMAAHEQNSAAFWAHYDAWVRQVDASDLKAIHTEQLMASVQASADNLLDSVARADVVVLGRVTSVKFQPTADAVVQVQVDKRIKGSAGDVITLVVPWMLLPSKDWKEVGIGYVEAVPVMYPGDSVILLLQSDPGHPGAFGVQPWSGLYQIADGSIHAVDGNPFAKEVQSMSEATLLDTLTRASR